LARVVSVRQRRGKMVSRQSGTGELKARGRARDGKERTLIGMHHNQCQVGKYLTQKQLKVGVEVLSLCTRAKAAFR